MRKWIYRWIQRRRIRAKAYGTHNLACPNCGNWRMEIEKGFLFPWLKVRRWESSIMFRYDPGYHPVTLICSCRLCGAEFGQNPVVPHEKWKVEQVFKGSVTTEVRG